VCLPGGPGQASEYLAELFGHSASGGTCLLYAAGHPRRLDHLVLAGPSLRAVGIQSDLGVQEVLAQRAHEPWFPGAVAALNAEAATLRHAGHFPWVDDPAWLAATVDEFLRRPASPGADAT
jgi:pimeloyl-ACP methyl ester carboxylesterase